MSKSTDIDNHRSLSQVDLWTIRALIQKAGWGEFMRHIGSFMAEQADKVKRDSEQDKSLEECSRTIHALGQFFDKCGTFDYRPFKDMIDSEFWPVIDGNPPGDRGS
jgi:hypothetical protein